MSQKPKIRVDTKNTIALSVENPFAKIQTEGLPEVHKPKYEKSTASDSVSRSRGRVEVTREKSGRAGKIVTLLQAFHESVSGKELDDMAFSLKKLCACGGSLKGRTIELQGDVCEQAIGELKKRNFKPVRCGF